MMSFDWWDAGAKLISDFLPAAGVVWAVFWGGAKASITLGALKDDVADVRKAVSGLGDRLSRLEGSISTHLGTWHSD